MGLGRALSSSTQVTRRETHLRMTTYNLSHRCVPVSGSGPAPAALIFFRLKLQIGKFTCARSFARKWTAEISLPPCSWRLPQSASPFFPLLLDLFTKRGPSPRGRDWWCRLFWRKCFSPTFRLNPWCFRHYEGFFWAWPSPALLFCLPENV